MHCVIELPQNVSDFSTHMDYVHRHPLKYGLVERVAD